MINILPLRILLHQQWFSQECAQHFWCREIATDMSSIPQCIFSNATIFLATWQIFFCKGHNCNNILTPAFSTEGGSCAWRLRKRTPTGMGHPWLSKFMSWRIQCTWLIWLFAAQIYYISSTNHIPWHCHKLKLFTVTWVVLWYKDSFGLLKFSRPQLMQQILAEVSVS